LDGNQFTCKYLLGNVRFGDAEFDYDGDEAIILKMISKVIFNADYFWDLFFGGKRPFEYYR
jgi:hypothetical protein